MIINPQSEKVLKVHFPSIWRSENQKFFQSVTTKGTKLNTKETKSLGKNSSRQKCLNKRLYCWVLLLMH